MLALFLIFPDVTCVFEQKPWKLELLVQEKTGFILFTYSIFTDEKVKVQES